MMSNYTSFLLYPVRDYRSAEKTEPTSIRYASRIGLHTYGMQGMENRYISTKRYIPDGVCHKLNISYVTQ